MENFNEEYIASIPHKDELCCIICEIDTGKIPDFSIRSNYHWQIVKCRMIIQIIKEVIASPMFGTPGLIYVIASKEFIKSDKLKTHLKNLDILYAEPQAVSIDIYTKCLNHTIQCKIVPLWNKVGQYFVHKMKFHVLMEEFNALKLKIIINDENTRLHFYPIKIKIPCIQLEDLGLLDSLITEFKENDNGIIDLSKYCKSVYILPSMRTVRLVSISKKIPSNCPFANYNELRKYWIDMNGYYLPETEDGIMYYEVKFHASKGDNFIYPSICVVKGPFQYIPCKDGNNIISQFIHDLCNTLNEVCDKQLYIYNSNKEINHRLKLSDELNTSKVNIPNENLDMIDKNCSQQLRPTIKYECDRSSRTTTPLAVKKLNDRENYINYLERFGKKQFMNFDRNKQISQPSLSTPLTIKTITPNDENNVQLADENTSTFFKEINLLLDQKMVYKQSQMKDNTFPDTTLKQKLFNAMRTTKFGKSIDVETLAKNNKLGEVPNVILSDWLYKHSIPHNKQAKKADLIEKVLEKIRSPAVSSYTDGMRRNRGPV